MILDKDEQMFEKKKSFTEIDILDAMQNVRDPDLHRDVVSLGMIKDIKIFGQDIAFTFELTTPACPLKGKLENDAIAALKKYLPDVGKININMTSRVASHVNSRKDALLPGVKNTIAVASGKGGVGKSTVAVNLAVALAKDGAKVGLIDADIYGPSIPLMFGISDKPMIRQENGRTRIIPIEKYGVRVISIGFLVDPNTAVIWRGPMASGAVKQFLSDVEWGELDYMIFDLPPGTGDIQLTLVQTIPLTGAVIVTTPQDISLADARRGFRMFERVEVPVFGIVENMSYHICPQCGHRDEIFDYGGGREAAQELGIPFLGEIPISTRLRESGDKGKPMVILDEKSEQAQIIQNIARNLAAQVSIRNMNEPSAPKIEILLGAEDGV